MQQDSALAGDDARECICMKLKDGGIVRIELYPEQAPKTVERILMLVGEGFYDGLEFHRVESFLVQTGKKDSKLEPLEGEMFGQRIWHEEGMVGMARLPTGYDTATTQFYIMKERKPRLNGEYTLFGRVVEGMQYLHKIKKGNKIENVSHCGAD
jgi:cyclophilin family peptidyl-prolyl cis-trans isomerase